MNKDDLDLIERIGETEDRDFQRSAYRTDYIIVRTGQDGRGTWGVWVDVRRSTHLLDRASQTEHAAKKYARAFARALRARLNLAKDSIWVVVR